MNSRHLPHFALFARIHGAAGRAVEVFGELGHVGHGPEHAEAARRVEAGRDAQLDGFVAVHRAPGVGGAHPEQLRANGQPFIGLSTCLIRLRRPIDVVNRNLGGTVVPRPVELR